MMEILNKLSQIYHRLKTFIFYRIMFSHIGPGTTLRNPLFLRNPRFVSIGCNVFIRDGIRIEVLSSESGRSPCILIGDNTNIEQNVHIVCRNSITIGANVSIGANSAIVDVSHPYDDINNTVKIGERISPVIAPVKIGEGTFIGIGAVVLPGVIIGQRCMIGANSVVNCDIPDFSVAAGVPVRILKRYDVAQKKWIKVGDKIEVEIR